MPIGERFQRLHMTLSVGASCVAIFSAFISVAAYFRVNDLKKLYDNTRQLELRLKLDTPGDGAEVERTPISWSGQLEIRPSSTSVFNGNATLELGERGIQIIPFVRPVTSQNLWWSQSAATVGASGSMHGVINIGDDVGHGIGDSFQVVLVSLSENSVKPNETFVDLPRHSAESAVITVTRAK